MQVAHFFDLEGSPELHDLSFFRHVVRMKIVTVFLELPSEDLKGEVAAPVVKLTGVDKGFSSCYEGLLDVLTHVG